MSENPREVESGGAAQTIISVWDPSPAIRSRILQALVGERRSSQGI